MSPDRREISNYEVNGGTVVPPKGPGGKIRWSALRGNPDILRGTILTQARDFYQQEGKLSQLLLAQKRQYALVRAISRYYPGNLTQLKEDLGIESIHPPGYWTEERIEAETRELLSEKKQLSRSLLRSSDRADLEAAISNTYPGGIGQLRVKLGIPSPQKSVGFWTKEQIEHEAMEFYQSEGSIDQKLLYQKSRVDLARAISRHYTGKLRGLKRALGFDTKPDKVVRSWTPEMIEAEANDFFRAEGGLTDRFLYKKNRGDLAVAIRVHYPGRMRGLKAKLQLKQNTPTNYWSKERIEEAALEFYQRENKLTMPLLASSKNYPLNEAIRRLYPGGIRQLKINLRLDLGNKPRGYWTPESMLEAAKAFYDIHSRLASVFMTKQGQAGLSSAITTKYPGGWRQLRIDLGIANSNSEIQTISPTEANEQLRRLVE